MLDGWKNHWRKSFRIFHPNSLVFSFERFIHVFSEAKNDVDELNCTIETHVELMQRKSTHAMQWYFENFAEFFTFLWIQAPITFLSTQGNSHLFHDFELTMFFCCMRLPMSRLCNVNTPCHSIPLCIVQCIELMGPLYDWQQTKLLFCPSSVSYSTSLMRNKMFHLLGS